MNTQDEKIDELAMKFMTHEEKDHVLLDMEENSLLLAPKAEESAAAALAKLGAVKGRFLESSEKNMTSYGRCETGQRSRLKHCVRSR